MFVRASFQNLFYETDKVHYVYNPSPEEKASFSSRFRKISQIGTTYLISTSSHRSLVLEVFVHNYWTEKRIYIDSILAKHGLKLKCSEAEVVAEALRNEQFVITLNRDIISNTWSIPNQEEILLVEKIKNILKK